jgi:hypothetical protein
LESELASLQFEWDLDYDGTTFDADATGVRPQVLVDQLPGARTIVLRVTDADGKSTVATSLLQPFSTVAGRRLFYNDSWFDQFDASAAATDDAAIAADKQALLPGQTAAFANYSSYSHGINGIMVDIAGLPAGSLSADDFVFRVGNSGAVGDWTELAGAPSVSIRPAAGDQGSSRVTLVWTSGAATNQWLQVTVKANGNTGLAAPDVFYFGNAVGESGNVAGDFGVTITDEILARNNPQTSGLAAANNRFDYNRDGAVTVVDQLLARNNTTTSATRLKQIIMPAALQAGGLNAQGLVGRNAEYGFRKSESIRSDERGNSALTRSKSGVVAASESKSAAARVAFAFEQMLRGNAAADVDQDLLELICQR